MKEVQQLIGSEIERESEKQMRDDIRKRVLTLLKRSR